MTLLENYEYSNPYRQMHPQEIGERLLELDCQILDAGVHHDLRALEVATEHRAMCIEAAELVTRWGLV